MGACLKNPTIFKLHFFLNLYKLKYTSVVECLQDVGKTLGSSCNTTDKKNNLRPFHYARTSQIFSKNNVCVILHVEVTRHTAFHKHVLNVGVV